MRHILSLTLFVAVGCLTAGAQQTASITGVVTDALGQPVPGAQVWYNNIPTLSRDAAGRVITQGPRVANIVRAGADGTYSVTGIPAGDYFLCAIGTAPEHLKSCEWISRPPTPIHVSAGQLTGQNFQLRSGTVITLNVTDPNGRIAAGGKLAFNAGVINSVQYSPAKLVSSSAFGRQLSVAVPSGQTVQLFIDSPFIIADVVGNAIATRKPSLIIGVGTQPIVISLAVQ